MSTVKHNSSEFKGQKRETDSCGRTIGGLNKPLSPRANLSVSARHEKREEGTNRSAQIKAHLEFRLKLFLRALKRLRPWRTRTLHDKKAIVSLDKVVVRLI
jgi:hypothetical protein